MYKFFFILIVLLVAYFSIIFFGNDNRIEQGVEFLLHLWTGVSVDITP